VPSRDAATSEGTLQARRSRHRGDGFRSSASFFLPAALRRRLQRLQILERDRPALQQIGNEQARGAAEEVQQIADHAASILGRIDRRLEQLRVADLLYFSERAFLLQPV